ncbi:hypothetical protein [Saccharopolyspora sp. ASAGF58]|uniref:hypothetical protein n=1 Tax=Saccharopolyspora sp. ASAGF58 TaxID=2719023 RepID=UPI001B30FB1D|nr:hypothetical protein [Saccharopolyspora sp. ASAGF58]
MDWLSWIADRSRQDEAFRLDLDRDGNADALAALVPQLVARYPQDTYLLARKTERPSRRRVITRDVFGALTDVVCLTDFPPHIITNPDEVTVWTAGKELVFAAKAEPVVRKLMSGNPVNIEQVAAETGVPADAIARTLVDEGVCAELTPELAAGFLQLGK